MPSGGPGCSSSFQGADWAELSPRGPAAAPGEQLWALAFHSELQSFRRPDLKEHFPRVPWGFH